MNKDAVAEMSQQYQVEAAEKLVPKGYKQTEVGVIPEDWEVACLKDIATFGGGTTPARKLFDRYYLAGTHPWVKTLDLNNGRIKETEELVTDAALNESSLKKHKAGSVLVAMYGGFNQIGRTGLLAIDAAINQALVAIIPSKDALVSEYLLSNLNYRVDYWKSVASSSRKDPNITSNDIKAYSLPLPDLEEQAAIARALSDTDALLSELEKLIVKKQAIKTATMQQLLTGRTRLPQFAHHPDGSKKGYKQSELGEIPEDWEVMGFDDVAARINTKKNQISASDYQSYGSYPVVDQGKKKIVGYSDLECKAFKVSDAGVIVFGDHTCIVKYVGFSFLVGADGVQVISGREGCNTRFLSYVMSFFPVEPTGYNRHYGALKESIYSFPKQDEQTAIATILSDMDAEIQALEQRLNKTRQIKQGMMQQLLTGKIRLEKPINEEPEHD